MRERKRETERERKRETERERKRERDREREREREREGAQTYRQRFKATRQDGQILMKETQCERGKP